MIVQIAVIALVVTAAIVWLWRRAINKQADRILSVADGIVFLRQSAGMMPRMVPVARTGERDAQLAGTSSELETAGFRMLGDVEEYKRDGTSAGVARWFVSRDGHVCGWFGMTSAGPAVLLLSEDAGRRFATTIRSAYAPGLTIPETIRRTDISLDSPLIDATAIHRRELSAFAQPVAVGNLDEALACFRRMTEHSGRWRSQQDSNGLLESDVRSIAGEHYEALGASLIALVNIKEMKFE